MNIISQRVDDLVAEFIKYKDWSVKYNYLIDKGKSISPLNDEYKKDPYLLRDCQSNVWLHSECRNGKIYYYADSDSVIIKGIIALLIGVFSDQYPEDVVGADFEFMEEIGLKSFLSPTRSNGLTHVVKQMKQHAQKCLEE